MELFIVPTPRDVNGDGFLFGVLINEEMDV